MEVGTGAQGSTNYNGPPVGRFHGQDEHDDNKKQKTFVIANTTLPDVKRPKMLYEE